MRHGTRMGRPVPPRTAVRQRSKRRWSDQYIKLPPTSSGFQLAPIQGQRPKERYAPSNNLDTE